MVKSKKRPRKRGGNLVEKAREQARSAREAPDLTGWISRWEAAEALGVTENTIINWERKGHLKPILVVKADRGGAERAQWLYKPAELAAMPRSNRFARRIRSEGEVAARAFELFNEGKTIREIVIALREEPSKIETLKEQWENSGGADIVINDAARKALESVVGQFKGVSELVDLVCALAKLVGANRENCHQEVGAASTRVGI
jgi:hypothetical protein